MNKVLPWNKWKSCPKCDHPNLASGTYYPAKDDMPEHLAIQCAVCAYLYRMEPKS